MTWIINKLMFFAAFSIFLMVVHFSYSFILPFNMTTKLYWFGRRPLVIYERTCLRRNQQTSHLWVYAQSAFQYKQTSHALQESHAIHPLCESSNHVSCSKTQLKHYKLLEWLDDRVPLWGSVKVRGTQSKIDWKNNTVQTQTNISQTHKPRLSTHDTGVITLNSFLS